MGSGNSKARYVADEDDSDDSDEGSDTECGSNVRGDWLPIGDPVEYYKNSVTGERLLLDEYLLLRESHEARELEKKQLDGLGGISGPRLDGCDWMEYEDDDGRVYFHNTQLNLTQWELPVELERVYADREQGFMGEMYEAIQNSMSVGTVVVRELADWERIEDEDGGVLFFHDRINGTNSIQRPDELLKALYLAVKVDGPADTKDYAAPSTWLEIKSSVDGTQWDQLYDSVGGDTLCYHHVGSGALSQEKPRELIDAMFKDKEKCLNETWEGSELQAALKLVHVEHKKAIEDVAYAVDEEKRRQRERLRQRLKEKKQIRAERQLSSHSSSNLSSECGASASPAVGQGTAKKRKKPPPPLPPGRRAATPASIQESPEEIEDQAAFARGNESSSSMRMRLLAWEEVQDPESGAIYYHNPDTDETRWETPVGLEDAVREEERDFMRRKYAARSELGSGVSVSGMVAGWQTVIVSGCGADGEAIVFFHRVSTGKNQWEQPREILDHETRMREAEAEGTWSGDRLQEELRKIRAQADDEGNELQRNLGVERRRQRERMKRQLQRKRAARHRQTVTAEPRSSPLSKHNSIDHPARERVSIVPQRRHTAISKSVSECAGMSSSSVPAAKAATVEPAPTLDHGRNAAAPAGPPSMPSPPQPKVEELPSAPKNKAFAALMLL